MSSLEAKIVVLGAQGVGKTSLVQRYCKGAFNPSQITSTVGASFMTKRVIDGDTDTTVRLQIWDTAGQERFRSISRLYYRGANACILCYSITDAQSFVEMGMWLTELRANLPGDVVLHVVGTKADIVARDPSKREVPFERCIAYVAENLAPGLGSTPPPTATPSGMPPILGGGSVALAPGAAGFGAADGTSSTYLGSRQQSTFSAANTLGGGGGTGQGPITPGLSGLAGLPTPSATGATGGLGGGAAFAHDNGPRSPSSKRSSGFWGQEVGWDACHEISAESGEGVEEVFRVVARKLVEQNRKMQQALLMATATPGTPGYEMGMDGGYFDGVANNPRASFRVGRDRRSWLFSPGFSPAITVDGPGGVGGTAGQQGERGEEMDGSVKKRKCC